MATTNPSATDFCYPGTTNLSEVKWFAGMAMQAFIAKQGIPESQSAREEIALWAFRMGQSMVATGNQLLRPDDSVDPEG
jgi:hypothetical protein